VAEPTVGALPDGPAACDDNEDGTIARDEVGTLTDDDDEAIQVICEAKKVANSSPEPPAALESWANPTEGGLDRKTVYTFFFIRVSA
jgi:hypothetical protein